MKMKINRRLLPIKAHFFFFFAALGPLLPQMNVFGRQLGISPSVMGLVTAVLPLLWAVAKPVFGYLVDYWPNQRKLVFMLLITAMTGSYCGLWFIPMPETAVPKDKIIEYVYKMNNTIYLRQLDSTTDNRAIERYKCHWTCYKDLNVDVYLSNSTYVNTILLDNKIDNTSCSLLFMDFNDIRDGEVMCLPKDGCDLICYEYDIFNEVNDTINKDNGTKIVNNGTHIVYNGTHIVNNGTVDNDGTHIAHNETHIVNDKTHIVNIETSIVNNGTNNAINRTKRDINETNDKLQTYNEIKNNDIKKINNDNTIMNTKTILITKEPLGKNDIRSKVVSKVVEPSTVEVKSGNFYMTGPFWAFVVLMCLGTVAFNVANCIGDAVCFDVLGDESSKYGSQRAYGTLGYGLTALLGGWLVSRGSGGGGANWTPAFVVAAAATAVDLLCCTRLTLPKLSSPSDSGAALKKLLRIPRMLLFIMFAVVAGTFDSFIIYYMFWFLEEMAEQTGDFGQIKLIEGVIVAGQSFIGEILFFALSGKIIQRFGYGVTMTFSLFCYGIRMGLISFITQPWHMVIVESIMQGPTYALCYSSIVGYAAYSAPPGYSATVQGIVAGVDDGLGFALGSLVGGQLYAYAGGRASFRIFALVAIIASIAHAFGYSALNRQAEKKQNQEGVTPEEGVKMLPPTDHSDSIYKDTVIPLTSESTDDR